MRPGAGTPEADVQHWQAAAAAVAAAAQAVRAAEAAVADAESKVNVCV
jgi:hypothetical protein